MGLKDNLPQFVAEEKYVKEILEAIEPEIDKIKLRLSEMLFECCVSTSSLDGVKRFERDYKIEYSANLSLEERKKRIINKMLAKKRLTKEGLIDFIKRNINNGQFYITNLSESYKFKVRIVNEVYKEELYNALFKARPAHLVFEASVVDYAKRCGTFKCNQDVI